jgi:uridine phosphorylase
VSSAVRDEGASYHYLPPGREVMARGAVVDSIEKTLQARNIPYRVGKAWTTDAPYRETPKKIAKRREEGCLVVEMEAAGMMAVAQFRDVLFGQILYGGDSLGGDTWDRRGWQSRADVREDLFWLCADVCLSL